MELPTISALEFSQIRESIKNYIKTKTDFKDYDFEGSNLSMLVDVLAYNSMYSSYNINMAANELNLDTAVLRDNVVSHAKRLGYTPTSYTSSVASYNITLNNVSQYQNVYIDAGPLFSVTQNNKVYTYITRERNTLNTSAAPSVTFNNIIVKEGQEFSIRYVVNNENENQRFFIPNNFVDADSIRVFVISDPSTNLEVEYQRKSSIIGVSPSDRIFFVEEVQDQKYEVIFGDDVIGRKLQNSEVIIISYVVTNGSAANDIATSQLKFIGTVKGVLANTQEESIQPVNIVLEALATKTDGGSEFEPIKSIKYRAPRYYASQDRAVVTSDYESLIQNIYANSDLVRVVGGETKSPPQYGKVFISIKPKIGDKITTKEKIRIQNELKSYVVGAVTPVVLDAIPFTIQLFVNIIYDKNKTTKTRETLINSAKQIIDNYNLDDEFKNFNGIFSSSKLICLIRDIDPSIKFVVLKTLFKRIIDLYENVYYKYELNYYTKLKSNIDTRYTLVSEPFCVKGYNEPLFLVAFSNSASGCDVQKSGNIYLSTYKKRIIAQVGKIDYETGKIEFSITSCQDTPINIYVIPENPDITTASDTYPTTETIQTEFITVPEATPDDYDPTQPLPEPPIGIVPPPGGDPFGDSPTNDIPGTTVPNPDGSTTTTDQDGTATTKNPDGTEVVEPPTTPVDQCQELYDKILKQGYEDNETKQKLIQLGCPPLDPDIDDFTPTTPDTCS